jgi:hypothetical protein
LCSPTVQFTFLISMQTLYSLPSLPGLGARPPTFPKMGARQLRSSSSRKADSPIRARFGLDTIPAAPPALAVHARIARYLPGVCFRQEVSSDADSAEPGENNRHSET